MGNKGSNNVIPLAERRVSDGVATGCFVAAFVCINSNLIKTPANYLHSIHKLIDVSSDCY